MLRTIPAVTLFVLLAQSLTLAADPVPPDHSTVRIVFVAPFDPAGRGMGQLDDDGKPVPMATAGDMIAPFDSIRPVSISIDEDFVGHALFGYDKVSPIFVLPSGKHKLTFACDGLKTVTHELHVLGTGSTQYLIVKLSVLGTDIATPAPETQNGG